MSHLDTLYRKLPVPLQHIAVSAYGLYWKRLRLGHGYPLHVREFAVRERYTHEQWAEYTQARLTSLLTGCCTDVPFYASTWTPEEKRSAREGILSALPLLEKEPLRQRPESFIDRRRLNEPHQTFHTSGSTGTPIASIWPVDEIRKSMAVREVRSAGWAGVSFTQPRATISGRVIVPPDEKRGPFHRYNAAEKQVYLSAYHIGASTAAAYVSAMNRHHVRWLTGYAVSSYLLARHILDQRIDVHPLDAVITTSEKVTPEMRTVIQQAFGCRVYEEYSTVENVVFASECEKGSLHVSPDIGIVEILRPDGSPCGAEEAGEVVVTGLMRAFQPLVRFRLGDVAAWSGTPCPCGIAMPVIKEIVGRMEDVLVGSDGRELVRFHGLFTDQPNIIEAQVQQHAVGELVVLVVGTPGFCDADMRALNDRVHARLGDAFTVQVRQVESIPRSSSGKFKAVVSTLANQFSSTMQ